MSCSNRNFILLFVEKACTSIISLWNKQPRFSISHCGPVRDPPVKDAASQMAENTLLYLCSYLWKEKCNLVNVLCMVLWIRLDRLFVWLQFSFWLLEAVSHIFWCCEPEEWAIISGIILTPLVQINALKHTRRLCDRGTKHIYERSQGSNYTCHGEMSCDLWGFYHVSVWENNIVIMGF